MSVKYDCQHYAGDEDCHKCSVIGYICSCNDECEEYVNFFGKQPYKQNMSILGGDENNE